MQEFIIVIIDGTGDTALGQFQHLPLTLPKGHDTHIGADLACHQQQWHFFIVAESIQCGSPKDVTSQLGDTEKGSIMIALMQCKKQFSMRLHGVMDHHHHHPLLLQL